jgi:hypothetical protein
MRTRRLIGSARFDGQIRLSFTEIISGQPAVMVRQQAHR